MAKKNKKDLTRDILQVLLSSMFSFFIFFGAGAYFGHGISHVLEKEINQAVERCSQAEGLKWLYGTGAFVCNNDLRGKLREASDGEGD